MQLILYYIIIIRYDHEYLFTYPNFNTIYIEITSYIITSGIHAWHNIIIYNYKGPCSIYIMYMRACMNIDFMQICSQPCTTACTAGHCRNGKLVGHSITEVINR